MNRLVSHQFAKSSLSRKFRIYNSECHAITKTEKELKASIMKFFFFLFFKAVYFSLNNSNLMSISVSWNRKSSKISIKKKIASLLRVSELN